MLVQRLENGQVIRFKTYKTKKMDNRDYEAMNKHNYDNDFIADVSVPKGMLIDFYNYIQKNDIDHNIPQRIEKMVETYLKSINAL